MLVDISLRNVEKFHDKNHYMASVRAAVAAREGREGTGVFSQNRHSRQDALGMWCRKCGKFFTRLEQVKLKMTGQKCTRRDLPAAQWLTREGLS